MATNQPLPTAEWRNVDLKTLRGGIIPRTRPAVLTGLVRDWPMVRASRQSDGALYQYIHRDDMTGLNFKCAQQPFHQALAHILACQDQQDPPAFYTGTTWSSTGGWKNPRRRSRLRPWPMR